MAVIRWIIGLIITICIALIAIMNRHEVTFSWSPVNDNLTLPLYAIILSSMVVGFIFGGIMVWINSGKIRKERRKQKKEIKLLEKEITRLKENELNTSSPPATDIFPALPAK